MNSSKLTVISNLRPFLLLLVIINHCTPVRFASCVNGENFNTHMEYLQFITTY